MTLTDYLLYIHPRAPSDLADQLEAIIGDSDCVTNEALNLDIGRLLAVADRALTCAGQANGAAKQRLLDLAHKAASRALWVSPFDPTNPEHTY